MTNVIIPSLSDSCLPTEVWDLIASFLDEHELAQFKQVCLLFNIIGSDARMLQPLYNRLRAIDNTLPADLQTAATQAGKSPLTFLKKAFEKIQAKLQQEIAYLTQHHPAMMAKIEYAEVRQQNISVSLKSLEANNAVLDTINSAIVTTHININTTELNLNNAKITRLPVALFQAAGYANFWQNLTHLSGRRNKLTALNLQGLVALQTLWCDENQLTTLNLQGPIALQSLWCTNNQLTALNLQGLVALRELSCHNNQLTALNLQGLTALQYLWCGNNQLTALNLQGLALQMLSCQKNPFTDLNLTSPTVLPSFSAYLPSAGTNNNTATNLQERPRDEEQMQQEKKSQTINLKPSIQATAKFNYCSHNEKRHATYSRYSWRALG